MTDVIRYPPLYVSLVRGAASVQHVCVVQFYSTDFDTKFKDTSA